MLTTALRRLVPCLALACLLAAPRSLMADDGDAGEADSARSGPMVVHADANLVNLRVGRGLMLRLGRRVIGDKQGEAKASFFMPVSQPHLMIASPVRVRTEGSGEDDLVTTGVPHRTAATAFFEDLDERQESLTQYSHFRANVRLLWGSGGYSAASAETSRRRLSHKTAYYLADGVDRVEELRKLECSSELIAIVDAYASSVLPSPDEELERTLSIAKKIIRQFGSHYISSVIHGYKLAIAMREFKSHDQQSRSTGSSFRLAASAFGFGVSASGESSDSAEVRSVSKQLEIRGYLLSGGSKAKRKNTVDPEPGFRSVPEPGVITFSSMLHVLETLREIREGRFMLTPTPIRCEARPVYEVIEALALSSNDAARRGRLELLGDKLRDLVDKGAPVVEELAASPQTRMVWRYVPCEYQYRSGPPTPQRYRTQFSNKVVRAFVVPVGQSIRYHEPSDATELNGIEFLVSPATPKATDSRIVEWTGHLALRDGSMENNSPLWNMAYTGRFTVLVVAEIQD